MKKIMIIALLIAGVSLLGFNSSENVQFAESSYTTDPGGGGSGG